jgi:two-component system LytT family response regulator
MDMTTCILIDDEPRARLLLRAIIGQYCTGLTIAAECADLPSGVKAIKKHRPELVFLDIEMPGHSGLELLDFFNEEEIDFSVIFTTAYNAYAIQAFRFSAIDYLLKPLEHTLLVEAVQRFFNQKNRAQAKQLKQLQENLDANRNWEEKKLVVPNGQSYRFLHPQDIYMIKGEGAYSEIYLNDGTKLLASKNLRHFEETLMGVPGFFRSHKSYLINLQAVNEYVKSDGGYLKMKGNLQAGISSDKVDEFLSKIR